MYGAIGKKHALSLTLVKNYSEFGGVKEVCGMRNRQTCLSGPLLYGPGLEITRQPPITTAAPDLHLEELTDVAVVGSTMAILRNGKLLHPELLHTSAVYDYKAPDLYRFSDESRSGLDFRTFTRPIRPRRIKVGLHLLKEHSFNYYHWLSECLPRLLFFIQNCAKVACRQNMALLIDENVLEQGVEALRHLTRFDCEVVRVRRGELLFCDRLFYVSPFWYALDNSQHTVNPLKDFVVDKYAVQLVREGFCGLMKGDAPTRKIYLPRKPDQGRKVINAAEVEEVMIGNGFEAIHGHEFSFREQVELFSSARIVVGATGAAFSNVIFMQPHTRAVIFSPNHPEVFNYYIFQQQADVAQVELAHLLTVPVKNTDFHVHDDYYVDCKDLNALLQRLSCDETEDRPSHA